MRRSFVLFVVTLLLLACRASGVEIYIDTNYGGGGRGNQLFDLSQWSETGTKVNGIWFVGQGMDKPPDGVNPNSARVAFLKHFARKEFAIELYHNFETRKGPAYEISALKAAGINDWTAMVYREDRKDSTLNPEDVASTHAAFKRFGVDQHPIIVNIRAFGRNKVLPELLKDNLVAGFSIEWASFYKDSFLQGEVIPAIQAAVRQKKVIYLLCNADHSTDFLGDVQRIFTYLTEHCRAEMKSPNVKWVLADYNADSQTQFTPEKTDGKYANTLTGATLCLIDAADRLKIRNTGRIDQAMLVGKWKTAIVRTRQTETTTFSADGTFRTDIKGASDTSQSGSWRIDGDYILESIKATTAPAGAGRSVKLLIKKISDDQLILQRGGVATLTYEREAEPSPAPAPAEAN
jgi:hypothetical protein